jgi:hypothetical protein
MRNRPFLPAPVWRNGVIRYAARRRALGHFYGFRHLLFDISLFLGDSL